MASLVKYTVPEDKNQDNLAPIENLQLSDEVQQISGLLHDKPLPLLENKVRFSVSRITGLFFSTTLSLTVLLTAAYYTSKTYISKVDAVERETLIYSGETTPFVNSTVVFDTSRATFPESDDYSSQQIVVFDLTSDRAIFTKNADQKTSIASLTKLASTQVLYDSININGITEITSEVDEINGSALHMKVGEKYRNIDLLKAAVISSSNQAVFAIDKPEETVVKMNDLARALHLDSTRYANPAGFDDPNNYSTATDLVQVAKLFFKHPTLKTFAATSKDEITELNENKKVKITNTNDLLRLGTKFVVAGKTGTTQQAGQNLLLLLEKDGREYIVILLNGADRYKDAYKILERLP